MDPLVALLAFMIVLGAAYMIAKSPPTPRPPVEPPPGDALDRLRAAYLADENADTIAYILAVDALTEAGIENKQWKDDGTYPRRTRAERKALLDERRARVAERRNGEGLTNALNHIRAAMETKRREDNPMVVLDSLDARMNEARYLYRHGYRGAWTRKGKYVLVEKGSPEHIASERLLREFKRTDAPGNVCIIGTGEWVL